ncbi:DUF262 domain-containing protein [Aliarcobacter lanthieri]|uniref:DUF262 domain-containing protein n=1 Tax=Aliarcobacter lanthieri TaxID=1355374 RepID=UPI00047E2098|nr:DUF262 domain-containing protein [Aliarcobacter lanthieri]QKF59133.1 DUF262 and DUF1524 domain-containing protein [Aliarcobacter lanthieri]
MVKSKLFTINDIVEKDFSFEIPIYQRLYVWKDEQVKILLDDLYEAFKSNKDIFYLGNVLVVENSNNKHFDLIDGQQRFTTLWMFSIVFKEAMESFIYKNGNFRLNFSIRDEVKNFFNSFLMDKDTNLRIDENISKALVEIKNYFQNKNKDIFEFTKFLMQKVQLLFTIVPKETDLNKLFELINNRGVQLQHHEILKAKILKKIDDNEKLKYSNLWDSCSYMDNYVEKNLRDIAKVKISQIFSNKKSKKDVEPLAIAEEVLKLINNTKLTKFEPLSLEQILKDNKNISETVEDNLDEYKSNSNVRSIITFSMLLQHTLRIYLIKKESKDIQKILDKELLNIFDSYFFFDSNNKEDVKYFIELLWRVRYMFDKYIIKWVETEDGETHLINQLYLNHNKIKKSKSLVRGEPESNEGVALLQSMIYHSQQLTTHYWLTPYLYYLYLNGGNNKKHYEYLRYLDNNLLSNRSEETLMQRTYKFTKDFSYSENYDYTELREAKGVRFSHYWFYKLEFVLWYLLKDKKDKKWEKFRFTAKNSVEHISPQHPKEEDTNKVSKDILDTFGNTSLVSRSINSEYSNLPYNEKRQRFFNKNKEKLDSLKMDLIYQNKEWNDNLAIEHQKKMFEYLEEYFESEIIYE